MAATMKLHDPKVFCADFSLFQVCAHDTYFWYTIIYVWKILESIVPNLNIPITCYSSIRRGRLCETSHVGIGHIIGTLVYHSFRFRGIRLFNAMPKQIRDLSCSVSSFKYQLDKYLSTIPDTPCIAKYDNSLENSSHTNPHLLTGVHPV